MSTAEADTEELLRRAEGGDREAPAALFTRHRPRLRRMISARMDTRLATRVDPSDVVQETLARAHRLLAEYLRNRPLPFFAWLRQLAWERLVDLHRHHIRAGRRSTSRELTLGKLLSDQSAVELAERLVASGTGPERALLRKELVRRVQAALAELADKDREVLLLRYVERAGSFRGRSAGHGLQPA